MAEARIIMPKLGRYGLFLGILLIGLYIFTHQNYLLFHSLAEIFSVLVAWSIFVIAWNSRDFINNTYLLMISIAYFFVGSIDLVHTLAYTGMGVFPNAGANLPTQLWIAARSLQAISLFIAPFFLHRRINPSAILLTYLGITTILLSSIFVWDIFPTCYVEGSGLTPFKIVSEYIICAVLLITVPLMVSRRRNFDPVILRSLVASILITIASEFCFTLYVGVYDFPNMLGHLLKIVAFYLVYQVLIVKALKEPYSLYFRAFRQNEVFLRQTNEVLESRIRERTADLAATNEALRKSEARYRILSENFPNGAVLLFDRDLRYSLADGSGLVEVGLSKSMLEGKTIWEVLPPETCQVIEPIYRDTLAGQAIAQEIPFRERIYLLQSMPIYNQSNEIIAGLVTTQNITDRKRMETAVRESELKYRMLFEANPHPMWVYSLESLKFLAVNQAAIEHYGYSRDEFLTMTICDIRSSEAVPALLENVSKVTAGIDNAGIWQHCKRDGTVIDVEITSHALTFMEHKAELVLAHDVTEQLQAKRALEESEERWQLALRGNNDGIWDWNPNTNRVFFSSRWKEMLGYDDEDIGDSVDEWISRVHPDDLDWVLETIQDHFQQKMPFYISEHRLRCKDGHYKWILDRGQALWDEEGNVARMAGSHTDVTDRHTMEDDLRDSEATFRAFLEAASEAIIVTNHDGNIVVFNNKAQEIFGYTSEEALGHTVEFLLPEDFRDNHVHHRHHYRQRPTNRPMKVSRELKALRKDGRIFPIEAGLGTVDTQHGRFVITFITDITERKQAQDELDRFFSLSLEPLCIASFDGYFKRLNPAFETILGYPTEQILATPIIDWVHPGDRQRTQQELEKLVQGSTTIKFQNRYQCQDGNYKWLSWSAIPVLSEKLIYAAARDITQQKYADEKIRRLYTELEQRVEARTEELRLANEQLRQSQEIYRQMFELNQAVKLLIDPDDGALVDANSAAAEFYGYPLETLKQMKISDLNVMSKRQIDEAMQQTISKTKGYWIFRHRLASGDIRDVEVYSSRLSFRGKEMLHSIIHDITERKQAEEKLRQSNERISLANAELARATRLKDEFLANMSHELRTPLNSILGLSEALQEEVYGSLTEKQRRSLSTIEQSGQHLLELINDVLDLSKVESGRMELQLTVTSVQNLCSSSLTFVKQQAHHKNLKLSHHINDQITEVVVDERRLRQVLINLLSNAVKFTPDGGEVRLEVDHDEANETVQFSVIDTGIGIEPSNMEQLFRPFVQLDSALSRRYAGTGLGLALVRRITELHGGSVMLESTVGEGSRFTITLPWRLSQHDDPANALWQTDALPHLSQALVVEDSEPAARQVSRYLQELGASVVIHPQGEGAVAEALQNNPDVIILDLLLPYLSGWEVLSQLKADPRTRHIPVLILSVMDERSQALELGAAEALVKPLSRQRLRTTLSQILQATDDSPVPPSTCEATPTTLIVTPTAPRMPRILLTDDNEANITTVMDYLKAHGYDVILARNGFEAVDLTRTEAPDLILMDIQMPEMDGLEATRRIREENPGSNIPILAMTALAMPGDRDRCLAIGMNDYLPKPVSLKNLLKAITHHLQQSPTSGLNTAASHD